MSKVAVIFGAGVALGAASARRFGREGYRIALVARNTERLDKLVAELAADGIEAAGFPADLSRTAGVPTLIDRIRARWGRIDVVEYAPAPTDNFTPAADLEPARLQSILDLFLLTPVAIVRAVLPEMLARGDGGILIGQGVSATDPMPGLSGFGVAMAGTRNYLASLHGEVSGRGVYVGVVHVAAMVLGSAGHTAALSGELAPGLDPSTLPTVAPADIAETLWRMYADRDRFEAQLP